MLDKPKTIRCAIEFLPDTEKISYPLGAEICHPLATRTVLVRLNRHHPGNQGRFAVPSQCVGTLNNSCWSLLPPAPSSRAGPTGLEKLCGVRAVTEGLPSMDDPVGDILAYPRMQTLNGIGGVMMQRHSTGYFEERGQLVPTSAPSGGNCH
jgi:hypothetical protein